MPADGLLRRGDDVSTDESLLTGESAPVTKTPTEASPDLAPPRGDGAPFLYSGSLLVRGQALVEIAATGPRTQLGKLGESLESIVEQPGRLTLETRRLVRWVGAIAFVVCAIVVLIHGMGRGDWVTGLLAGIALGMAMVPEEFPLDAIESAVDYDFVRLGEGKFLLPVHAENLACERGTPDCSRNAIDFRNYHKYGSESTITFGSEAQKDK